MPPSGKMHPISAIFGFVTIAVPVMAQARPEPSRLTEGCLASAGDDCRWLFLTSWKKDDEVQVACAVQVTEDGMGPSCTVGHPGGNRVTT